MQRLNKEYFNYLCSKIIKKIGKMKNGALFVVAIVIISCISSSCSQSKSLQELLQEEQKAIDKFITMNNFDVPNKSYPSDGVFKENEYFRTTDGLFFHVVDSGNGKRAQLTNNVYVRYDYFQFVKNAASGDTTKYPFGYPELRSQPYSFVYGISVTYGQSGNLNTQIQVCPGWVVPLSYVGENAVIDMIVPSSLGSYYNYTNVVPIFYKNLRYTRIN